MTEAEEPSLTSGTMTPMVKLRWARRERAKKFGRYLYLRAASRIRAFVSWGMESATGERLMTSETVAGDRPRRSASSLRLTGFGPMRAVRAALLVRFFVVTLRSLAQTNRGIKRMFATADVCDMFAPCTRNID